jgi:hypothetical protein
MKTKRALACVVTVLLLVFGGRLIRGFASTSKPIIIISNSPPPPVVTVSTFSAKALISQDIFADGGSVTADSRLAAPTGALIHYTILYHPNGAGPSTVTLPPQLLLCSVLPGCFGPSGPFVITLPNSAPPQPCQTGGGVSAFIGGVQLFLPGPCGIQINSQTLAFEFVVFVVGHPGESFELTLTEPDGTVVQSAPIKVVNDTPGPPA